MNNLAERENRGTPPIRTKNLPHHFLIPPAPNHPTREHPKNRTH